MKLEMVECSDEKMTKELIFNSMEDSKKMKGNLKESRKIRRKRGRER